jgi:hypothetical protein
MILNLTPRKISQYNIFIICFELCIFMVISKMVRLEISMCG